MTEGVRYRIGVATRGFRGGVGEGKFYINQTLEVSDVSSQVAVSVVQDIVNLDINPDVGISVDIFDPAIEVEVYEVD